MSLPGSQRRPKRCSLLDLLRYFHLIAEGRVEVHVDITTSSDISSVSLSKRCYPEKSSSLFRKDYVDLLSAGS